jgi:hypothetical protein
MTDELAWTRKLILITLRERGHGPSTTTEIRGACGNNRPVEAVLKHLHAAGAIVCDQHGNWRVL